MYFVIDNNRGFIQIGGGRLHNVADFLRVGLSPVNSKESFETFQRRILKAQKTLGLSRLRDVSMRLHYRPRPGLKLFSGLNVSRKDCKYILWDVEEGRSLGDLPLSWVSNVNIRAEAGCVRIDGPCGQTLRPIHLTFQVNGRTYMVMVEPIHSRTSPRLANLVFALLLLLLSVSWITSQFLWAFRGGSENKSTRPATNIETHSLEVESATASDSHPSAFSHDLNRTESEIRLATREDKLSKRPIPQEKFEAFSPPRKAKQIGPVRRSNSAQEGRHSESCKPIVRHHESPLLRRLMQQDESQGEWYVCR